MDNITNLNLEPDSDSDEYIDLSVCVEDDLKHIFQFHLSNEKLIIKHIGKSTYTPDIIIMENFGPESNMFLYSCVYSQDELESSKKLEISNENEEIGITNSNSNFENSENNLEDFKLFFPIVKLIIKSSSDNYIITSIAVKLNQQIVLENEIKNWDLYWIENSSLNKEHFKTLKLEKNINPTNILENIIKLSLD